MSSSTIRKAIGVVKDQTSISIAKVTGNVAPDLEVLILKATGHDSEPAEEKYIREILHLISQSRGYATACVYNISRRLSKTHHWVVALKALMLVHRLLVDGDPAFSQEMMYASRKGTRVLTMSDFRVEAFSNYWDHSVFVKNYALYLNQKLEFIAFERKLSPTGFRDDHSYGISHKSVAKKESELAITPVREMKPDRVLERLNKLVRLIDRVLACRPAGVANSSKMVLAALYLVLNESFWVYSDLCEALGVLLDRFPEMEYGNCLKAFDQHVNAAKTIDELVDFYSWSKDLQVVRVSEFPEVQKVTDKILGTLEKNLREKKSKNMEENGPSPPATVAVITEDLVNLKDDMEPPPPPQPLLALAVTAPGEKVQPVVVDPRDPFAASLMVPPPQYVQLADMEKKGFLVQDQQQVWKPYGSNVGWINGGVGTYNGKGKQAGYHCAHF